MQNKIVGDVIQKNIQYHIAAATYRISKSLQWHKSFKEGIKAIYKLYDPIFQNN